MKLIKLCAPTWMNKEYPKKAKEKKLKRFYNFLKSKNIVIEFYHGTSDISWELIQRDGIMTPPTWRNKEKYEDKISKDLGKIFFTKNMTIATSFANNDANSWNNNSRFKGYKEEKGIALDRKAKPIVIKKNVPLHYLDEIKGVIFGTWVTETQYSEDIKNIILSDSSDEDRLNEILSLIEKSVEGYSEFSIKGAVPISRKEGFQHIEKMDTLEFWTEMVKTNPNKYYNVPKEFKNDPDILKALKNGWIKIIENDPYSFSGSFFNDGVDLKNDVDILDALKSGWIKKLKNHPYSYSASEWIRSLAFYDDYFGLDLKNDVDILDALKSGWIKQLEQDVYKFDHIKQLDLKNDVDILDTLKTGWIRILERYPVLVQDKYNYVPEELKNDPDILKYAPKEETSEKTANNSSNWFDLSKLNF